MRCQRLQSKWGVVLVALVLAGVGCQSLVKGRQRPLSSANQRKLLERSVAPELLGIQLTDRGGRQYVRWREMAYPDGPVKAQLLLYRSRHSVQPQVIARLNSGRAVPMTVDTGSPVTLIQGQTALDNNVPIADPERLRNFYRGLGGDEQTFYGMCRQMTVGYHLALRNVLMAIRPERNEAKRDGVVTVSQWEANLIGLSTLMNFAFVTLDYPARQAVFSRGEYFAGPSEWPVACVPFLLQTNQIRVVLAFGETNTCSAIVDTGNDACLMINSNLVRQLGWQALAEKGYKELYVGLGGEFTTRAFTVPSLQMAGVTFTNVAAVSGPEEFGVMVGSGFLQRYRTTFDFRRKQMWLE